MSPSQRPMSVCAHTESGVDIQRNRKRTLHVSVENKPGEGRVALSSTAFKNIPSPLLALFKADFSAEPALREGLWPLLLSYGDFSLPAQVSSNIFSEEW